MAGDWKVVPVEPTPEMIAAGRSGVNYAQASWIADRYAAMLAAAPLPPSASDEREGKVFAKHTCGGAMSRNPHADAGKPGHTLTEGCVYECIPCTVKSRHEWSQRALKAETALREHAASNTEPVAVVGEGFALFWAGSGPIAPLIERHGLKVGSRLYSRPAPSPGVDAAEQKPVAWLNLAKVGDAGMAYATAFQVNKDQTPVFAVPSNHASADEWMAEAERLVWALRQSAREDGAQGSDGYDSPSIVAAEKQAASDEAALLAHLKAYPKG